MFGAGTRVLMLVLVQAGGVGAVERGRGAHPGPPRALLNTNGYSSTYLAMGFADARANLVPAQKIANPIAR